MRSKRWSFLLPIVSFTLACALATWLVLQVAGLPMSQMHWGILSYFMMVSLALHAWQEHAMHNDPKGFVRRFMASLSIKMFLSFFLLLALLLILPQKERLSIAIAFIALYFAYLGFGTARLTHILRKQRR